MKYNSRAEPNGESAGPDGLSTRTGHRTAGNLLQGVRVLDLTNVLAGPFSAYQLALFGADVIKVEVPGAGDLARSLGADPDQNDARLGASFLAQNAGKRSLTLNLKSSKGRDILLRGVQEADILVENFRPTVLERLGLGWEVLHRVNPRLIYCSISGFGHDGPLRDRPAYDQVVQGLAGMMSVTGTVDSGPLRAGFPVADTLGGMAAAFAMASALVSRDRTNEGTRLDVSMLEAALTAMGWVVSNHLAAGQDPVPMGNHNFTAAPSGTFQTLDGALNIAANQDRQFAALCSVLDCEHLPVDPRFSTPHARKTNRSDLTLELEKYLTSRPAEEWEKRLTDAGVPAGRVLTVPESLSQDQIQHRGFIHEVPYPKSGSQPVRVLGSPTHVAGAACGPSAAPPRLGEHTDGILTQWGYTPDEVRALHDEGVL